MKMIYMKQFLLCTGIFTIGLWTLFYFSPHWKLVYSPIQQYFKNMKVENFKVKFKSYSECPRFIIGRSAIYAGFGNHIMEYASAWAVAKQNNMTVVVADEIIDTLSSLFYNLSVPRISKLLKTLDVNCSQRLADHIRIGPEAKNIDVFRKLITNGGKSIILRPYIILVDAIVEHRSQLKNEFRFRSRYYTYAQETFRKSSEQIISPNEDPSQITYVGVHVRRKDYHVYLRNKYGLKPTEFAGVNYFCRAIIFLLKKLHDTGNMKVVFLIVSDDKAWSTNTLIPQINNHINSKNISTANVSVQWRGSKHFREDFTLLSFCNHSIITYGTFGSSAALFTDGWTVVFDISSSKKRRRKTTAAMHFARDIPLWTYMK